MKMWLSDAFPMAIDFPFLVLFYRYFVASHKRVLFKLLPRLHCKLPSYTLTSDWVHTLVHQSTYTHADVHRPIFLHTHIHTYMHTYQTCIYAYLHTEILYILHV
jgi:hypothetical protein